MADEISWNLAALEVLNLEPRHAATDKATRRDIDILTYSSHVLRDRWTTHIEFRLVVEHFEASYKRQKKILLRHNHFRWLQLFYK